MSRSYEDEILRLRLLSAAHPNARILTHLAEAYRKSGDLQRARETVERGLERHAEYPSAHVVLGRVLDDLGDAAGAERAFRRVLELDPENAAAREWLSRRRPAGAVNGNGRSPATSDTAGAVGAAAPAHGGVNGNGAVHGNGAGHGAVSRLRASIAALRAPAAPSASRPGGAGPPLEPTRRQAPAARPIRSYLDRLLDFRPGAAPTGAHAADADRVAAGAPDGGAAARAPDDRVASGAPDDARAPDLVELVDLLVGLLEYRDPFYRGGSSLTRLIAVAIGRELGIGGRALDELALAALLRDLGRLALGGRLVDPGRVEPGPEERRRIEAHVDIALRLLEGIALPGAVRAAIRHHHERWDGGGYPDGRAGPAIPLGARILAVADSLAAMISPRPYRPPRRFAAAIAEIRMEAGTRYDPAVVDALIRTLPNRLRRRALDFGLRHHVIVVDADRPRAITVAARLCSHGYLAEAASGPDDACQRMRRFPADAVILAADLPGDGAFALLDALRADEATAGIPVVAVHADAVERRIALLERGADACFAGGVAFHELRATLGALLKRAAPAIERGSAEDDARPGDVVAPWHALRGDLHDFPLAWLLQVLNYDVRTAAIDVRSGDEAGTIYVERGNAVHAHVPGATGEAALRTMLRWTTGSFVVRPNARANQHTVERSVMHLLLEHAVADDHAATILGAIRSDD
ncbi:MAG TPA: HD domain-containing phosphohydrolase [Longimicrobiales bacterium]